MKRDRQDRIQWGRVLRRSLALFLATLALWALATVAGAGAAADALQGLGSSADFVAAALRAELGDVPNAGPLSGLDGWGRLVLGESALLRANIGAAPPVTPSVPPAGEETAGGDPLPQPTQEDPDDPANLPAGTTAPDDIIPRTLVPTSTDGYAYADGVYIFNRTDLPVDAAALSAAPVDITLGDASQPQVLIVHTHATEAYTPDGEDVYQQTDNSRTLDNRCNMVRVGNEIKAVFEEMGLSVLHDENAYDYPAYNGAYGRSKTSVEAYLEQYPSIKVVLDVHRDALIGDDGTVYKAVTTIDGASTAQVMLVLGSPAGGEHPNWLQNLALAMRIQKSMNLLYPTLARPITIRSSVYNQDLTPGSLLVEVGCHGNTLQEAIAGGRAFARAAGQVLLCLTAGEG